MDTKLQENCGHAAYVCSNLRVAAASCRAVHCRSGVSDRSQRQYVCKSCKGPHLRYRVTCVKDWIILVHCHRAAIQPYACTLADAPNALARSVAAPGMHLRSLQFCGIIFGILQLTGQQCKHAPHVCTAGLENLSIFE